MSNAFEKASLVMLPHAYEDGKVYSLKPTDRSGDFTFSRGSDTATRVGEDGYIKKETSNLLTYSNTFDDASWTWNAGSATGGQTDRDGGSDAYLVTRSSGGSALGYRSISLSGVYTFSIYVKINASNGIGLAFGSTSQVARFNISDESQTTAANSTGLIDSTQEYVGNDFYRLTISSNTTATDIDLYMLDATGTSNSSGGGSHIIQDAQLEQGLVAQDYLETTTVPVYGGLTDDMPRLDYTDATCPSLLLEPSRTNLAPYSEYIEGLGLTDLTATPNATTSPEGLQNAYKMLTGTTGGEQIAYQATGTSGNTKTQSVYIKADSGVQWIRLIQVRSGFSNSASTHFDIQNGVKGAKEENGTTSVVDDATKIENAGNGWYRLTLVCTDSTNNTNFDTRVRTAIADGSPTRVSNGSYFVWGYQMESNASYPTSYIPTYGSTQTRAADDISTVFSTPISTDGNVSYFIHLNGSNFGKNMTGKGASFDFASNDYITYNVNNAGFHRIRVNAGGSNTYTTSVLKSEEAKILTTINGTNVKVFVNGVENYDETLPVVPDFTSVLSFVTDGSDLLGELPIKQILLFPTALSDDECIALTQN